MMSTNMIKKATFVIALLASGMFLNAKENVNSTGAGSGDGQRLSDEQKILTGCVPGKVQTELKLNNVRTRVLTDGDMWWDLTNAKYEIPKGSNSFASFAGSLWFGGYVNGSLRVSAMTYRQNGVDFWPGPLDPNTADVDATTCQNYDKHWRITREEVDIFYAASVGLPVSDPSIIPTSISNYPGNPPIPTFQYSYLAPYYDADNDGVYDPTQGDYPNYNVTSATVAQGDCKRRLFGDETLFWVFNDAGNSHSESGSIGNIGVEIRAQAFAFSSSDELNDMTFYNFEIINRSSNTLDSTIFAVWVDADLGSYIDDIIGCDVGRGLGYIYNGDNYDEDNGGQTGYHDQLPALGCDFFQGPGMNYPDGKDNDNDGCVDCTFYVDNLGVTQTSVIIPLTTLPEQIIMSRFSYYNNTGNAKNGNPGQSGNGLEFYNLMNGKWRDGTSMFYGSADGIAGSLPCSYMYPGTSDPIGYGVGGTPTSPNPQAPWFETAAPGDRRFLQSAGQFKLEPGAVNYITFGMPFTRSSTNNNLAAIPLLQAADDKAQALFDNCFKVLDGPDAPDLTIQEMDKQIIIYLSNKPSSNNYEQDRYIDLDVTINPTAFPSDTTPGATADRFFRYEGYMIYQLKDATVSQTDLKDANKARLVFQTDLDNNVAKLINYNSDPILGNVPELMVDGVDNGIVNSFLLTQDMFAEGDKTMVNHKTYYFMAIAYAYNNHLKYVQDVAPAVVGVNEVHPASGDYKGQKKPFLRGRKNIKTYSGIPHIIAPESGGTTLSSSFGSSALVTRYEGQGNGGKSLEITSGSISAIMSSPTFKSDQITYERGRGPIEVKVVDPLRVCGGDFKLKFMKNTGIKYVKGKIETYVGSGDSVSFKGYDSLAIGTRSNTDLDSGKVAGSKFGWEMTGSYVKDGNTYYGVWHSDAVINVGGEKVLVGRDGIPIGLSVTVKQVDDPQRSLWNVTTDNARSPIEGDVIESSISDGAWLTGVSDVDGSVETNWIRSGTETFSPNLGYNDYYMKVGSATYFGDPAQIYEDLVGGTWAPYRLTAGSDPTVAGAIKSAPRIMSSWPTYKDDNKTFDLRILASVDVVFTSDKSKWTRCPVLEMKQGFTTADSTYKFFIRKDYSIDKNGNKATAFSAGQNTDPNASNFISSRGMGWFPGYVINVETGERLNVAYGENSSDVANNGNDMMWNPTNVVRDPSTGVYVMGGMHYLYVFGHNSDGFKTGLPIDVPRYDHGAALYSLFKQQGFSGSILYPKAIEAWKDAMWVTLPILKGGSFGAAGSYNVPGGDVKVKLRVKKPFRYGQSGMYSKSYSESFTGAAANFFSMIDAANNTLTPSSFSDDTLTTSQNSNYPMYGFSSHDLVPKNNQNQTAQDALALINIVPNPYYGHSAYEKTRIDNVVKITNLPVQCKIRIYTLNGTLIRTLEKDNDAITSVDWDLTNKDNIRIASGLYIIHIDAPGIGERILKWFGVMRPFDLQSY